MPPPTREPFPVHPAPGQPAAPAAPTEPDPADESEHARRQRTLLRSEAPLPPDEEAAFNAAAGRAARPFRARIVLVGLVVALALALIAAFGLR